MTNDIRLFILLNGQEVVGRETSHEPTYYVINEPLGIQMVPTQDGSSYGLQLVPFCASGAEGGYRLYHHAICAEPVNVPIDIEKAYVKQTSKIQLL